MGDQVRGCWPRQHGSRGGEKWPEADVPHRDPMALDDELCVAHDRKRGAAGARRAGPKQLERQGGQQQSERA